MKFDEFVGKKRIMIVDDDKTCEIALNMMLKKVLINVEIFGFKDGFSALNFLENSQEIDLIFTDITMPGMSGDELAVKIKGKYDKIKIIGLSGMESNEELSKIFDILLIKPINSQCLKETLHKVFSGDL